MHAWSLPLALRPHPDRDVRCRVFAAALLEGKVLELFADLAPCLALAPSMASRADAQSLARVGGLVAALREAGVDSRAGLAAAWSANPGWLRPQLEAWMKKGQAHKLVDAWPGLVACSLNQPASHA